MEDKARAYEGIQNRIFFTEVLICLAFLIIFTVSGASNHISAYIQSYCPNIWLKIYVYVVYFALIYLFITLPLSFYGGFFIEKKYDLSTETFFGWIWDKLKAFLLSLSLFLIAVELIYFLLRERPVDWWLWGAVLWIVGGIILARIAPRVIIPLFFKLERIEDETLRDRLRKLGEKAHTSIKDIYRVDLSRKSRKANAAVVGLGSSKRIILSDTLMRDYTQSEIGVVLAHELGHYAGKDLFKRMVLSSFLTLGAFYLAGRIMPVLAHAAGINSVANIASLPIFVLVLFAVGLVLMPLENAYSRRLEGAADAFALEVGGDPEAFISAMEKLAERNLIRKEPNKLVAFILHGHPSISSRVAMAKKIKPACRQAGTKDRRQKPKK